MIDSRGPRASINLPTNGADKPLTSRVSEKPSDTSARRPAKLLFERVEVQSEGPEGDAACDRHRHH